MKVVSFGSINIDYTFRVPHIVTPGETISSTSLTRTGGGKGANQAVALARAGAETYLAGKIGPDGAWLVTDIEAFGVDTRFVLQSTGPSGQAIIQLDDQSQNSIIILGGSNHEITIEEIDATLAHFSPGDWIILQNEIVQLPYLINKAAEQGMHICLNPSPFSEELITLPYQAITLLVVNEVEASQLTGLSDDTPYADMLEALIRKFPETQIVLTAGKDGAYYGYKAQREKGETISVPVVETTGAGDTFLGFFVASLMNGEDAASALRIACAAGSLAVSKRGATASIPSYTEVQAALEKSCGIC